MMNAPAPQLPPDMLMAMMTDPRSTPQQKMAAMSALNAQKGQPASPAPLPAMQGDSTGISTLHPAFAAAVRDEVTGGGQSAAPSPAPQSPTTSALMSGAADAARVAGGMAQGGAVRGYAGGGDVTTDIDPSTMTGGDMAPSAAPADNADDDKHGYYALIRKQLAGGQEPLSAQDKWTALLEASLGTMAAASRPGATFLGSIGEGGLGGIQGLRRAQASRAEERMRNAGLAGSLAEHESTVQARKDALAQQAAENALRRKAEKERADADRDSRERLAKDNADLRLSISQGNQGIQAALAAAAAERAAAATANAPVGVTPATPEQAKTAGIPFEGIPNPYANVGKKAQEEMYKTNEKLFETNQIKQQLVSGVNQNVLSDLNSFKTLNEKQATGPTNNFSVVAGVRKYYNPDLQEMDSITQRLAPVFRNGLPGSASDADVRMFKGAGPEIGKDKTVNDNRIAAMSTAIQNAEDKAQFDKDFFTVHHHLEGADKAWKEYLKANPIFDHTKGVAPFTLNPTRKTYREYFGGDVTAPTAGAAEIVSTAPAATRPPLSSFGKP